MKYEELMQHLADIHNVIADIKVCGDDAIRMGSALSGLRSIVKELSVGGLDTEEESSDS